MRRFGPAQRRHREPTDPNWQQFFRDEQDHSGLSLEQKRELSLADIGLSVRTVNTLESRNIFLVGELATLSREHLLAIQNFGEKTLAECQQRLDALEVPHADWGR